MDDALLAIAIIWSFVFVYAILGSIDFGTGFWAMIYGRQGDTHAAAIANRYLSPSWKVTNVFLVLLVTALVGFFPHAMVLLGTLLVTPVCLVLLLLLLRSTFMVYSHSSAKYIHALRFVSGVTGVLIPGLLITLLPVTLGGFVAIEGGEPHVLVGKLLSSWTEYAHLFFGISTELFLSALFLADYAREAEDLSAYRTYRTIAIGTGPLTLASAVLTAVTLAPEAQWIAQRMQDRAWLFGLSAVAFAIGYSALWWKGRGGVTGRPRAAVVGIIVQFGLASFAYGAAHLPYLVYPYLTIEQGVTNPAMFQSLLIGYGVGTVILVPVFFWFWRLFLKDKRYLKQD